MDKSQIGRYVDLVAPGGGVLAATRVRGHAYWEGTSFAAPFVSGTAALVRAAHPDLPASAVSQRLLATASPARGGQGSLAYGRGVVDPYRAVTDELAQGGPIPPDEASLVTADPDEIAAEEKRRRTMRLATALAGTAAGLAAVLLAAAVVLPRGRRRRWAPGRRAPIAEPVREEDEPVEYSEALFTPRPRH